MKRAATISIAFVFLVGACSLVVAGGEKEVAPAEEVTIVFSDWHLAEPHWEKALNEAMTIFEKEHPGITVDMRVVSYAEKETKYTTEIEAGKGPDVFHLHAYSVKSFLEKGYARDLTSFIEREGPGFTDVWYSQTLEIMRKEGRFYALPGDFMSMVLFYNTELFREAGLDPDSPPGTWKQFLDYAKKLTRDRDGDGKIDTWGFGTIGAISPGFELRFTPVLFSHGGQYLTDDHSCSMLHTPAAREAFTFFTSLVFKHKVVPPGVTSQNPGSVRQQMANERVAMLLGSGWTPPIVDTNNPDLNALEVLRAAPVPVKEGYGGKYTTTAWLSAWLMNPNTDHPEASWQLMKFITSREMEQKWFDDARVLSSRQDVSGEYAPLLEDKFAQVIAGQLAHSMFVPQVKEWPQVIEAVNTAAQEAMTKAKAPDRALGGAHEQINRILRVYRESGEQCPKF
jgi:multiple sugar transport system substrate-binding protein